MKVFVAARAAAKKRRGDFSRTVDGELIRLPIDVCDSLDLGSERAVAGLGSTNITSTFAVIDNPLLDADGYVQVFIDAMERQGWLRDGDDDAWLADWAGEHLRLASGFSPGQVLELERGRVRAR